MSSALYCFGCVFRVQAKDYCVKNNHWVNNHGVSE